MIWVGVCACLGLVAGFLVTDVLLPRLLGWALDDGEPAVPAYVVGRRPMTFGWVIEREDDS